jgi:hypothetical protein
MTRDAGGGIEIRAEAIALGGQAIFLFPVVFEEDFASLGHAHVHNLGAGALPEK